MNQPGRHGHLQKIISNRAKFAREALMTVFSDIYHEPSLEEMFAEPIIQLIMRRDGVQVREMRRQFDRLQDRKFYRRTALQ
jgi:hypothetical protein